MGRKSPPRTSKSVADSRTTTAQPNPHPAVQKTTANVALPIDSDKKQHPQEEPRLIQFKPPPGLTSVGTMEPFKQEAWPTFDPPAAKKAPSTGPPPGFPNLPPESNRHSLSLPVHPTWSVLPRAITIPPGFLIAREFPTLRGGAGTVCTGGETYVAASPLLLDADVIKFSEDVLKNSPSKVAHFRKWSGKYLSGAVSVDEYYLECDQLFGPIWKELGPRLATTIPDKQKQDKLLKKFGKVFVVEEPPPWNSGHSGSATAAKKQAVASGDQSLWLSWDQFKQEMHPLLGHGSLSKLSEEEYPSLGSKVGVPTHSNTATWSYKVSVK